MKDAEPERLKEKEKKKCEERRRGLKGERYGRQRLDARVVGRIILVVYYTR
jgi:hypothetical protein